MMHKLSLLLIGGLLALTSSFAQAWQPTSSIEIIVAAGPGGGNDKTARMLAKLLQVNKLVPTPIIVMNKPGAGGVIAQNYLNAHAGNGHYLMVTNPAIITNPLTGIGKVDYKDLTPIAQLFTEYVVLIARKGSTRVPSIQSVLKSWKKDPGELTLGVAPAIGAGTHIAIAEAAKAAGVDPARLRIIPFSTSGEVVNALMGGHIDLMASTPINVLPLMQNGMVKPLAVTAPHRLGGALAETPTFKELGINALFGNWRGIVAPEHLPTEQRQYWDSVFKRLEALPEWQSEVSAEQAEPTYMGSARAQAFLDEENAQLTKTLKQLGFDKH